MSALAHGVETAGIPTTVIGLVRPHLEAAKPPRSLFVPFQLGRPLGEPDDVDFQRRILLGALRQLESTQGPVVLEDFADNPPGWADAPGWRGPASRARSDAATATDTELVGHFTDELALMGTAQRTAAVRRGRTTIGLSRLAPAAWADVVADVLAGRLPTPPPDLPTAAVTVRFMADDIKAFYGEAAQASGPAPSSRQLDQWFWRETAAGEILQRLRRAGMASDNNAMKTVAGRFFVPTPHVSP